MSVGDWNSIGQNQQVKIMTVDPASRRVEAVTKDGAMIQIAVWGQPTIFRWPKVGEIWYVVRMSGYWILTEPVQKEVEESAPLEGLNPGDVNVTTGEGGHFLANGLDVVITDESLAANGDAPKWNATQKKWIPGATGGGSSSSWAARGYGSGVTTAQEDLRVGMSTQGNGHAWEFWVPLTYTGAFDNGDSGDGWTYIDHIGCGHPTLLVPPGPGAYEIGGRVTFAITPDDTSGGGPLNTAHDFMYVAGLAVVGLNTGGTLGGPTYEYYTEYVIEQQVWVRAYEAGHGSLSVGVPGFAPKVQDPSESPNFIEYGFGLVLEFDQHSYSIPYAFNTITVNTGWGGPNVWAHKV